MFLRRAFLHGTVFASGFIRFLAQVEESCSCVILHFGDFFRSVLLPNCRVFSSFLDEQGRSLPGFDRQPADPLWRAFSVFRFGGLFMYSGSSSCYLLWESVHVFFCVLRCAGYLPGQRLADSLSIFVQRFVLPDFAVSVLDAAHFRLREILKSRGFVLLICCNNVLLDRFLCDLSLFSGTFMII